MLRYWIVVLAVFVSACAHVPGPGEMPAGAAATNVYQWQLAGRFFAGQRPVNGDEMDAAEPVVGRFAWQHLGNDDTLWVLGPLGNTLAKVQVTPTGVTWQDATGKRGEANNLRALGETMAGIRLPDIAADTWLRGRWKESAVKSRDSDGRVLIASAAGWTFEYRYGLPAPEDWPLSVEGAGPDGLWLRIAPTEWDGVSDPASQPRP